MDQRLKESISALMDDEANELELQRVLSNSDEEVSATWQRYHQIRQVMRESGPEISSIDVRSAVSVSLNYDELDAMDDDVDPFASSQSSSSFEKSSSFDSGQSAVHAQGAQVPADEANRVSSKFGIRSVLAIAASGLFALVLATQYQQGLDSNKGGALVADSSQAEVPVESDSLKSESLKSQDEESFITVAASSHPSNDRAPKIIEHFSEEHAKRFNEYLLRHAEHSVYGSGQGVMPLARVASVNSVGI